MANESRTLGTQRTIRDYLLSEIVDSTTESTGVALKLKDESIAYEVDLLWGGQEYLISYKTLSNGVLSYPKVCKLSDVLPITFTETEKIATNS